jgi:predicted dehydrogenase
MTTPHSSPRRLAHRPVLTRRDLLARAARGAVVAGMAGTVLTGEPAFAAAAGNDTSGGGKKVGFAVVGLGQLSLGQILPAFKDCKLARPVALVSGHPDKARQTAEKYSLDPKRIYNYENYDSMKDNPEIDVVYVVLPNSMHAEYTVRAAKAGKHVLCEKPMANSAADCRKMIDACRAAGKKLQIGYRLRYEPNTIALIDAVAKKQAGELKMLECGAGFNIGDPNQWRLNKDLAGGGCLMDIGIYALNASRYITGEEPVEVNAMTFANRSDPRFKEVEEHCNFQLRFPSGVLANCASSYSCGLNRFRAYCARGWAEVDPGLSYRGVNFRIQGPGQRQPQDPELPDINQFAAEMDAMAECVLHDKPSRTPGEEGLRDLHAIEAIYESARTGKAVKVEQGNA